MERPSRSRHEATRYVSITLVYRHSLYETKNGVGQIFRWMGGGVLNRVAPQNRRNGSAKGRAIGRRRERQGADRTGTSREGDATLPVRAATSISEPRPSQYVMLPPLPLALLTFRSRRSRKN